MFSLFVGVYKISYKIYNHSYLLNPTNSITFEFWMDRTSRTARHTQSPPNWKDHRILLRSICNQVFPSIWGSYNIQGTTWTLVLNPHTAFPLNIALLISGPFLFLFPYFSLLSSPAMAIQVLVLYFFRNI